MTSWADNIATPPSCVLFYWFLSCQLAHVFWWKWVSPVLSLLFLCSLYYVFMQICILLWFFLDVIGCIFNVSDLAIVILISKVTSSLCMQIVDNKVFSILFYSIRLPLSIKHIPCEMPQCCDDVVTFLAYLKGFSDMRYKNYYLHRVCKFYVWSAPNGSDQSWISSPVQSWTWCTDRRTSWTQNRCFFPSMWQ